MAPKSIAEAPSAWHPGKALAALVASWKNAVALAQQVMQGVRGKSGVTWELEPVVIGAR